MNRINLYSNQPQPEEIDPVQELIGLIKAADPGAILVHELLTESQVLETAQVFAAHSHEGKAATEAAMLERVKSWNLELPEPTIEGIAMLMTMVQHDKFMNSLEDN